MMRSGASWRSVGAGVGAVTTPARVPVAVLAVCSGGGSGGTFATSTALAAGTGGVCEGAGDHGCPEVVCFFWAGGPTGG